MLRPRDYRGNSLKRNELYRDVGRVHLFHELPFPFFPFSLSFSARISR